MKEYSSKVKFTSSDIHLKSIFSSDYYLELGNIEIDVMKRILNGEVVKLNDITYYPIQNKGLGTNFNLNGEIKDKLPYMFFKNLNEKDRSKQLYLTYGLLDFYNADLKDRFIPIFLIPVDIYYVEGEFSLQMISKPFENPLMSNVFPETYKNILKQVRNFNDLFSLDYALSVINKIPGCEVKLENYLTFGTIRKRDIIEAKKLFNRIKLEDDFYITKTYNLEDNYFMSVPYTKLQRKFFISAMQGDNLTLSGHDGTGKTTILKDICLNKINEGKRVVYITNKKASAKEMKNFFEEKDLGYVVADFTSPFNSLYLDEVKQIKKEFTEIDDLLVELNNKYDSVDLYEKIIGGRIADFRFGEIIEELGVLIDLERSDEVLIAEDEMKNLDYIYKHEFNCIKSSLENIQTNLYKLKSFKDCVWKQIPIINNIKYANQIISLINDIYKCYEKLVEYKKVLEDKHGIREIENYADFRKIVNIFDSLKEETIPQLWRDSYENYKEASGLYSQLKGDIYNFQESKYFLNSKYNNYDKINIEEKIQKLHGNIFDPKDHEGINKIIVNNSLLKSSCDKGLIAFKDYNKLAHTLRSALHWNFVDSDEQISSVIELGNLINNNELNLRLCMCVLDGKQEDTISNIESIKDKISKAYVKIDKMKAEYVNLDEEKVEQALEILEKQPKKARSVRKKYNNISLDELHELFNEYKKSLSKIKTLKEKYFVASGFKYDEEYDPIIIINSISDYYNSVKTKSYSKTIDKFFESIDSRKRNGTFKKIYEDLKQFCSLYIKLNDIFEVLEENALIKKDNKSFVNRLAKFEEICEFVNGLYETNKEMLSCFKHHDEDYIKYEGYLHFSSLLNEHNKLLDYLKNNETYKYLYGYLYESEKTNVVLVSKVLQTYSDVNSLFKSSDDLIKGFKNIAALREVIKQSIKELDALNEILKIYAKIFRDGVSRYYYNNFASIIEYLNALLNSKEDLICYLSITNGLTVLNTYNLKSLINYIATKDKCDNIVNNFEYLYFNRLKEKYLESINEKYDIIASDDFVGLLQDTYELEEKVRTANNENIIKQVFDKTSHRTIDYVVKNRDFNKYVRKNNGKMVCIASGLVMDNFLSIQEFDVIIIDDAELLNGVGYFDLLKNKQIIIAGSYQVHKAVSSNLLSLYFDDKTIIFKERFYDVPKKLVDKATRIDGLIKANIYENDGVEVITEDIEKYVYNLYQKNKNVKINYFIKDVDKHRELISSIAYYFSQNNCDCKEVLDFLDYNINISDLLHSDIINADYNILEFSDYVNLDSNAEAANAYDKLLFPKEKLVIFDEENQLILDSDLPFFSEVKSLVYYENNDELFDANVHDECTSIIISSLKEKGYIVYPAKSNVDMMVAIKDRFVGVSILFSDNSYSEILNHYRQAKTRYNCYGWEMIFISKMMYCEGLERVSDYISDAVDKILNKGKKIKKGKK